MEEREKAQDADTERGVLEDDVEGHAIRDTDDVEGHSFQDDYVKDEQAQNE